MSSRPRAATVRLVGERLCLDFANSIDWDGSEPVAASEVLATPGDAIAWGLRAGVLDQRAAGELRARTERAPAAAAAAIERLREARRAVRGAFAGFAAAGVVEEGTLGAVNRLLATYGSTARLTGPVPGSRLACEPVPGRQDDLAAWLLGPIAWSLGDLLASPRDLARVKRCPAGGCGWLFLDGSRGGTRRWCSMETCGNRAKARAHHRRRTGAAGAAR